MSQSKIDTFWARKIRAEIPDSAIATNLISGIKAIIPDLRSYGFNQSRYGQGIGKARAESRKELRKVERQLSKLTALLSDLSSHSRAQIRLADMLRRGESLLSGVDPSNIRRSDRHALDELEKVAVEVQSFIADSGALLSSAGNPSNQLRDLLVISIGRQFSKWAPSIKLSNSSLSLFYRTVDQFLTDEDVDAGNLSRTIIRLFPDGHFTI